MNSSIAPDHYDKCGRGEQRHLNVTRTPAQPKEGGRPRGGGGGGGGVGGGGGGGGWGGGVW